MNWEFVEYLLSKFYTVSRAVFAEEATWLFHNLLCALSPPPSLQSTCTSHARHANESENALNSNSHSHFFYFLSFVLRILHNGCSVKGGQGGRRRRNTAKKLDRSTRAQVGPIEGQYSGHARELVNRFIARLVDRFDYTKGEERRKEWRGGRR